MVKLDRIYTRGGDSGETSLVDGSRHPKFAPRIAAFGTVDEANAIFGIARLYTADETDAMLARIQNDLFDLGADLATPGDDFAETATSLRIVARQVERLEAEIDAVNAALPPLTSFVLPGGAPLAAYLHLARTVVRRAERLAAEAATIGPINPLALQYLNRLSDLLFVLARTANRDAGTEPLWQPGLTR